MALRPTLDEIFDEEDAFGLLAITLRRSGSVMPNEDKDLEVVLEANAFFEAHERLPEVEAPDIEEMRLATIIPLICRRVTPRLRSADRNGLLDASRWSARPAEARRDEGPDEQSPGQQDDIDTSNDAVAVPDWRDDPDPDETPATLDDIFDEEFGEDFDDVDPAFFDIRNVTRAAHRETPDHRAEARPCADFEIFRPAFEALQAGLDAGERRAHRVEHGDRLEIHEGDVYIRKGLLAYVAEKSEPSARRGKREHRLRVVFSNGTESDLLMLSFRKSLADDPTARQVDRPGGGPLFPDWEADRLELTGVIYVARSLSQDPRISEVSQILHKIGVTSQDVRRRVADARNDPTFLMAPVEIVATFELKNLSRRKVENLLHRFFEAARPRDLWITDRFGKKVHPREWFYVLPEHVARAAEAIRDRTLHTLEYDPGTQEIRRRENPGGDSADAPTPARPGR